jgi:TRAP-type transport system periplasmic protein
MRVKSLLTAVLLAAIACFAVAGQTSAEGPITLTYSVFFPATHVQSKLAEEWGKEVEKRTNGKVKVELYTGGTLTKGPQVYDGVVTGISDVGLSVLGYTLGRFPLMEVVDLPLGYRNGVEATAVANAVYDKFKDKALTDTEVMYLHAHGPGLLHIKGQPVKKLEDLKGLKIRGHGTSSKTVAALGATPVAKAMGETYQILEKGVVDGSVHPIEANKGWNLVEVIDSATLDYPASYTTTFFVVMNKDKWNSLPEDVKKVIKEINKEWIPKHAAAWDESDKEGMDLLKERKKEIIQLDAAEAAKWSEAVKPVLKTFVDDMKAKNLPGQEALDTATKTLDEARKK